MIFLQCVGGVCRGKKSASYLQGGSEMIIRKNNNRKTKSSGHRALPITFLILSLSGSTTWGGGCCKTVAAGHLPLRSCLQKLSSWSSADLPSEPLWICPRKHSYFFVKDADCVSDDSRILTITPVSHLLWSLRMECVDNSGTLKPHRSTHSGVI